MNRHLGIVPQYTKIAFSHCVLYLIVLKQKVVAEERIKAGYKEGNAEQQEPQKIFKCGWISTQT